MKMRGNTKKFGRCSKPGHAQGCCVTAEIRENPIGRNIERDEISKQVDVGIDELLDDEEYTYVKMYYPEKVGSLKQIATELNEEWYDEYC